MRIDILQRVGNAAVVSRGTHMLSSELEGDNFLWDFEYAGIRGREVLRSTSNTLTEDFQRLGGHCISVTNGTNVVYFEFEVI